MRKTVDKKRSSGGFNCTHREQLGLGCNSEGEIRWRMFRHGIETETISLKDLLTTVGIDL